MALHVRQQGEVSLLQARADGSFAGLEAGGEYLVLSTEELKDADDASSDSMTREQYVQWVMRMRDRERRVVEGRRQLLRDRYVPLHPQLAQLPEHEVFEAAFVAAAKAGTREAVEAHCRRVADTGVYAFDMLKPSFCSLLLEELLHFLNSGLPCTPPNSMNKYGVILDELGFSPMLREWRRLFISAFAKHLFVDCGGDSLDGHHAFLVGYSAADGKHNDYANQQQQGAHGEGDKDLGLHYDNSDVTLNVCLGKEFQGGDLFFCGLLDKPETHGEQLNIPHRVGQGLLHRGNHRHGATQLTAGERFNLIIWCQSSERQRMMHEHAHAHGQCSGHGHEHGGEDHDDEHDHDDDDECCDGHEHEHGHDHGHDHGHGHDYSHEHSHGHDHGQEHEGHTHEHGHNHEHQHQHHHAHGVEQDVVVHDSPVSGVAFQVINLDD